MKVFLFPHTHWDREWYKPFQAFRIRLVEVMDGLLEEVKNGGLEYFYLDGQTILLEDYLELYPEKRDEIKDLILSKKLFIGPWYVLADEFLVSGESLVRNLLVGINQAKSFGCEEFFGYMPDSFGHNSEIPKILNSFGIKNAVLWRGAGDKKSEFIWKSNDDSSVLTTYLTEGYFQDILHSDCSIDKLKELLDKLKTRAVSGNLLLPVGGDHMGAVKNLRDKIKTINSEIETYKLEQKTIGEYFRELKTGDLEEICGELRDNSRNPVLPGVFSTRLYLKQKNAVSSWKLSRMTEPLQTFLQTAGITRNRKNELDFAWKLLLKNHPHDSICGCSVDEVHEENVSRFKQVDQISDALIDRCIEDISKNFPENELFICNLSNYKYSGVVKFITCRKLPEHQTVRSFKAFPREVLLNTQKAPFCEDIKEFNEYLTYVEQVPEFSISFLQEKPCPDAVEITENKINNSLVEINVNHDGTIDLKDLETNKSFKNLHTLQDRQDSGDTYNYSPVAGDKPVQAEFIRAEIAEKGKLRSILRVFYRVKQIEFSTDIIITACSKLVEFMTNFENKEENHLAQIRINLPEKIAETLSENTFGLIKREFDPDYKIENSMPVEKGHELSTNSAPMQRFLYTQGLEVLTEGVPEFVVSKHSILLPLVRATGKLSEVSCGTRGFPAGPPLGTPGAQCLGKHCVRYAVCPVENSEKLFKIADEFMGNIISGEGKGDKITIPETLINISNENIIVYGVKSPELRHSELVSESIKINTKNNKFRGIIIRCLNISENTQKTLITSDLKFSKIIEVNSLEENLSGALNPDEEIAFKPNELKSLLLNYTDFNK